MARKIKNAVVTINAKTLMTDEELAYVMKEVGKQMYDGFTSGVRYNYSWSLSVKST